MKYIQTAVEVAEKALIWGGEIFSSLGEFQGIRRNVWRFLGRVGKNQTPLHKKTKTQSSPLLNPQQ